MKNESETKISNSVSQNQGGNGRPASGAPLRTIVIALLCFFAGLALGGFYFSKKAAANIATTTPTAETAQLDESRTPPPAAARPAPAPAPQPQPVDPATLAAVNQVIPNPTVVSVELGSRKLREAGLAGFQQALKDLQARQKQVEQDFLAATTEDQKRVLAQQLRELQAEQFETLKQIAADAQAQIDAFQQLKTASK